MASLAKDPGGKKRIIFTLDGNRKTIYLGKMTLGQARSIKHRVECLVSALTRGHSLDPDIASWIRDMPYEMAGKLANVGLTPKRENTMLGGLIEAFLATRTHVKPATLIM